MGTSITVTGAEGLARLSRALRDADRNDLSKELNRALQRASGPLKKSARQGAQQILPYRGGLADRVAGSRFTARVTKRGKGAGLQIVATGRDDIAGMDAGKVRHPVFGNRSKWVTEKITPGWFTKPLTLDAPKSRGELVKAIDAVAKKLQDSV